MPGPLSLITRKFGRRPAERAVELAALTRRTGHEHGATDVLHAPGRIYTSGKSSEVDIPKEEWLRFIRARQAGKLTWDMHTHPSDAPGDPVNSPSYMDVLESLRMGAIRPENPHSSLVMATPEVGDSAYGYRLGPTKLPWKTQMGMLDRLHLDVPRLLQDRGFQDRALGAMAEAGFDSEPDAVEWLRDRLLDTLRPMRLAERDRLGGETWRSTVPDSPSASRVVEMDPMVDELYRIARGKGLRKGGLARL